MKAYTVIVTHIETAYVNAESEEHAIRIVEAKLPPRSIATVQVAKEINADEETN